MAWAVISKADTQVAETAVLGAFAMGSVIVTAYISGAVYEDVRLFKPRKVENDQEED